MKGFTLVELLVVVAVIAGLVGILLPQLNNFNQSQTLQNSAKDLQTTLRMVQNNAASGVKCNSTISASFWYAEFTASSTTSYITGATCSNSDVVPGGPTPATVPAITNNLTSDVTIRKIVLDSCSDVDLVGHDNKINFSNISGEVSFETTGGCPASYATTKMTITLQSNSGGTVNVVVEKGGSVYVSSQ